MDFNMNHEVNCSTMNIKDIKLNVFNYYTIVDVKFDNVTLAWQLTPSTPYSSWLWILGVDYTQSELTPYSPVPVTVRAVPLPWHACSTHFMCPLSHPVLALKPFTCHPVKGVVSN